MSDHFPYRTRRTVKPVLMDSSREIAHELLLEILEDAHWAPTHGLTQPWRFHVFTGGARTRLAEALQVLYDQITPLAEVRSLAWKERKRFLDRRGRDFQEMG